MKIEWCELRAIQQPMLFDGCKIEVCHYDDAKLCNINSIRSWMWFNGTAASVFEELPNAFDTSNRFPWMRMSFSCLWHINDRKIACILAIDQNVRSFILHANLIFFFAPNQETNVYKYDTKYHVDEKKAAANKL